MRRLLFCFLLVARMAAQDFAALEQTAREEMAKSNVPGASIAIVRGDRVIYSKAIGIANVETGEAVRPEMVFRLGSTTKMLTASALVGLSVEGKLDLNATIGKYITGLPPKISQITASQFLSHTSGIHDEAPMYGSHDDAALGAGIHAWTDAWLFTAPGKIFSYSNPGYWMCGFLVETLSGKPYADAMEARVFQPLGMTRTTLRPMLAMTWPLAAGHDDAGGKAVVVHPAADNAASWPAGSVFSNAQDLSRFVIAFLNGGMIDGKQVIDPKTIALMSSPYVAYPDSAVSYGYGLTLREIRGVRIIEHGGSRSGYGSFIRMAPEQRVGIIVQANRSGAGMPATVDKATELLLPLQPKPPADPPKNLPVTAEDLKRMEGAYQNGAQRIQVIARDGKLLLKRGSGAEAPLIRRGPVRYATEGGPEFVAVAGADGRTEYLFSGARALARVR